MDTQNLQSLVREQLRILGEDPERPGLVRTPERVEKSLRWQRLLATEFSMPTTMKW